MSPESAASTRPPPAPETVKSVLPSPVTIRLPNGRQLWAGTEGGTSELLHIYNEIFLDQVYEKEGVTIRDGDVLIDLGANVGLFSLKVMAEHRDLTIHCFEPAPLTRACLERNLAEAPERGRHTVHIHPEALGAADGEAVLSFLPGAPGNSTLYAEQKLEEIRALGDSFQVRDMWRLNKLAALYMLFMTRSRRRQLMESMARNLFASLERVPCKLKTLGTVIREQGLQRIDLLKIDVEGAELDILQSLSEAHWQLVRQLVMECSPRNKQHLAELRARLAHLGFSHFRTEGMHGGDGLDDSLPCMLYARR